MSQERTKTAAPDNALQADPSGLPLVIQMLNEFILKQLDTVIKERDSLNRQLDELTGKESEESKIMQAILDREDVGVEVFSPRSSGKPVKVQVEDIRQRIEDIECQEALVRDELEQTLLREEKLRRMLSEAKASGNAKIPTKQGPDPDLGEEALLRFQAETHETYQVILKRIDRCCEIGISDPEACRTELRTLQYYLKALLTKTADH